jgi:hypothetical protein
MEGDVQACCSGDRLAVRSAEGRDFPPLEDVQQVKVWAKVLEVGEDACPSHSQELPTLGVDELRDPCRGLHQLVFQLAEEEKDRSIILGPQGAGSGPRCLGAAPLP